MRISFLSRAMFLPILLYGCTTQEAPAPKGYQPEKEEYQIEANEVEKMVPCVASLMNVSVPKVAFPHIWVTPYESIPVVIKNEQEKEETIFAHAVYTFFHERDNTHESSVIRMTPLVMRHEFVRQKKYAHEVTHHLQRITGILFGDIPWHVRKKTEKQAECVESHFHLSCVKKDGASFYRHAPNPGVCSYEKMGKGR